MSVRSLTEEEVVSVAIEPIHHLTYAQTAVLLDCHVSNIPKLICRGLLTSHSGRGTRGGTLDRAEVEVLAERRRADAEARANPAPRRPADRPPDTDHGWLTVADIAQLVSLSAVGVRRRITWERLPAV